MIGSEGSSGSGKRRARYRRRRQQHCRGVTHAPHVVDHSSAVQAWGQVGLQAAEVGKKGQAVICKKRDALT